MNPILETNRLILREFHLGDTTFIIELLNSPGWLEFIGDRNVKTEAEAKNYLENGPMKSYLQNGYGLSMVVKKDDNACIGMCGIIKRDGMDYPDIGFAFLPEYGGFGYAFEIANATIVHAIHQLKIPKISAITVANNTKSIKLLEKIGLHFQKTIFLPNDVEELLLYSN